EIVVDQPLYIMCAGRDAEHRDGLCERDLGIESRELPAQLGQALTGGIAFLWRERHESLPDVLVAEDTGRPHLLVDIEEELTARLQLAIKRFHRSSGIRRVMQYTVCDDEVEIIVRKRRLHEVGLHHSTVRQVARVFESREGGGRDIESEHLARAMLGDEFCVE